MLHDDFEKATDRKRNNVDGDKRTFQQENEQLAKYTLPSCFPWVKMNVEASGVKNG